MQNFSRISGLLIDLEGVLYSDNKLIKGAVEAINTIRKITPKFVF
jgi:ribonucleotide monophosphatase NagD (HAD superfamily)